MKTTFSQSTAVYRPTYFQATVTTINSTAHTNVFVDQLSLSSGSNWLEGAQFGQVSAIGRSQGSTMKKKSPRKYFFISQVL